MDSLSFKLKLEIVNSSLSKPSDFYVDLICKAYISNELKIRSISVTVHNEKKLIRRGTSTVKYANFFQIDQPRYEMAYFRQKGKILHVMFLQFRDTFPCLYRNC